MDNQFEGDLTSYTQTEFEIPFQGRRPLIAYIYICFNVIGFLVNSYVLYVVAPLLCSSQVKVPKSILFYILVLCTSDVLTLAGMFLLIMELVVGTWKVSTFACVSYMFFDSMNKFVAPIIVVFISRTCYSTICLDRSQADRASSLKFAILQVLVALCLVAGLLWPVFAFTEVSNIPININHSEHVIVTVKKCAFVPPSQVEYWFNIIACISSYAIPLFGFIYWYLSVSFFLRKHAETTLIRTSSNGNGSTADIAIKKVTATVLVLTVVYIGLWSPYWLLIFGNRFFVELLASENFILIMYLIHLLPYVSCCAYPLIFTIMNRAIQRAHSQMLQNQRRRIKNITMDIGRHVRDAFNLRLLDRDNSLFPRSSISVATTAQRIVLSSHSPSLQPPDTHMSQLSASFTNIDSCSPHECLVEKNRRHSCAEEIEATF